MKTMRIGAGMLAMFLLGAAVPPVAAQVMSVLMPHRQLELGHGSRLDFDDMRYAPALGRVLVPAAQSGDLVLLDPAGQRVERWKGVVPAGSGTAREDAGTTSADTGSGLVFVSDHRDRAVLALSTRTHRPVARARLASGPDYVRYVAPLAEVWVTEPGKAQIERFAVRGGSQPSLTRVGVVAVPGGPESLVVDVARGVAYSNEWSDHTVRISLHDARVTARWPNTCRGSRGLALDAADGVLLVGCKEGRVVALDPSADGKVLGHAVTGAGVDIIAWNPHLRHIYAPGAHSATLTVLRMDAKGKLTKVAEVPAAPHAHCVATDGQRHAYVCAPGAGAILVYTDNARP